jgi:hypothetical protein
MDTDSWFGVDDENIDRAPLERKQSLNPRPRELGTHRMLPFIAS